MIEPRGNPDLEEKPVRADCGRQLGTKHLDGDRTIVFQIPGEVHRRHTAGAQFPLDGVSTAQSGRQMIGSRHPAKMRALGEWREGPQARGDCARSRVSLKWLAGARNRLRGRCRMHQCTAPRPRASIPLDRIAEFARSEARNAMSRSRFILLIWKFALDELVV